MEATTTIKNHDAAARPAWTPSSSAALLAGPHIWRDAADFTEFGGWALDTQYVCLMGSAYLMATGVGTPVKDAVLQLDVEEAGTYRLWARCRNWLPSHSPGQFHIAVNGQVAEHVFGAAQSDAWLWESGGEFELEAGKAEVRLQDLTGYYGRCGSVVLTRDLAWQPREDLEGFRAERARCKGLPAAPVQGGQFQLIVAGAGAAGCCAARTGPGPGGALAMCPG